VEMFPIIENKDDFIAKIRHKPEMGICDRGYFTVIQYNLINQDTFDTPEARECRGIIFDNATGKILRRPFEKFFNVNQIAETQADVLDRTKKIIQMTEKLDGTMIAPFLLNGQIFWGSKRCAIDFNDYIISSGITRDIEPYVKSLLLNGKTPIFEWHDPTFDGCVIVIKYKQRFIKLLAVRDNITGEYEDCRDAIKHGVEVVPEFTCFNTVADAITVVTKEQQKEGYVLLFNDNTRVKLKTLWYCARHRLIDFFNTPWMMKRLIVNYMIEVPDVYPEWANILLWNPEFDGDGDDVISNMSDVQQQAFRTEILEVQNIVLKIYLDVGECLMKYKSKKEIGLSPDFVGKNIAFKVFDGANLKMEVLKELRDKWFNSNKNHNARLGKL